LILLFLSHFSQYYYYYFLNFTKNFHSHFLPSLLKTINSSIPKFFSFLFLLHSIILITLHFHSNFYFNFIYFFLITHINLNFFAFLSFFIFLFSILFHHILPLHLMKILYLDFPLQIILLLFHYFHFYFSSFSYYSFSNYDCSFHLLHLIPFHLYNSFFILFYTYLNPNHFHFLHHLLPLHSLHFHYLFFYDNLTLNHSNLHSHKFLSQNHLSFFFKLFSIIHLHFILAHHLHFPPLILILYHLSFIFSHPPPPQINALLSTNYPTTSIALLLLLISNSPCKNHYNFIAKSPNNLVLLLYNT
jgi:hypothetical protein